MRESPKRIKLSTAKSSSPRSRLGFFDLPPELRNRIYIEYLVLPQPLEVNLLGHGLRPILVWAWVYIGSQRENPVARHYINFEPDLLQTNSRVRAEATPIYYSMNRFTIGKLVAMSLWWEKLGPERRKMVKKFQRLKKNTKKRKREYEDDECVEIKATSGV